jgi:hypothetical protein
MHYYTWDVHLMILCACKDGQEGDFKAGYCFDREMTLTCSIKKATAGVRTVVDRHHAVD